LLSGLYLIKPLIFDNGFSHSIFVLPSHNVLARLDVNSALSLLMSAITDSYALYLAFLGIVSAWIFYRVFPKWPGKLSSRFSIINKILINKYGFDLLNEKIIMPFARWFSNKCFLIGDIKIVDNILVNGSAKVISKFSSMARKLQSGYLYHYVLIMAVSLLALLCWMIVNVK
jgi:NADH-quinone oxidoreductase subunit L